MMPTKALTFKQRKRFSDAILRSQRLFVIFGTFSASMRVAIRQAPGTFVECSSFQAAKWTV